MPKQSWVVIFVVLLLFAIVSGVLSALNKKPSPKAIDSRPTASFPNQKDTVERDIKTTFTSSVHKDIITYVQLASGEKDQAVAYRYYAKAYEKMLPFYNETKDAQIRQAMVELRDYAKKTHSQFKESDFPEPR